MFIKFIYKRIQYCSWIIPVSYNILLIFSSWLCMTCDKLSMKCDLLRFVFSDKIEYTKNKLIHILETLKVLISNILLSKKEVHLVVRHPQVVQQGLGQVCENSGATDGDVYISLRVSRVLKLSWKGCFQHLRRDMSFCTIPLWVGLWKDVFYSEPTRNSINIWSTKI